MSDYQSDRQTYVAAKGAAHRKARSSRIFGVLLDSRECGNSDVVVVRYCGNPDAPLCTDRLLHIAKQDILATGKQKGFDDQEHQVHWLDIDERAVVVEEAYVPYSLAAYAHPDAAVAEPAALIARFARGSIFGGQLSGGVFATPIAPVGPTPIAPVGPTPIAPVGPTPIAPVGPTPIAPVGPTPITPV